MLLSSLSSMHLRVGFARSSASSLQTFFCACVVVLTNCRVRGRQGWHTSGMPNSRALLAYSRSLLMSNTDSKTPCGAQGVRMYS